uniref:Uncharacterized protein n=1 Tax=Oryza rufipogon TaxID=4529 RepID=A0A0E0QIP3_ORYRU
MVLSLKSTEKLLKHWRSTLSSCPAKDIVLEAPNFMVTDEPDSGVQSKLDICDHESPSMHDAGKPVTTEEKATEFSEFFAGEGFKPSFERVLKQSLERVRISPRWIESIRPCSYSA